ncbi:MAG TPA: YraN family protein [Beutenbergiaceae bacterium]|nr:YraN family protein [Beutenbergiaceae bacterium]
MTTQKQRTGARGEQIAVRYLRSRGMSVLATNWRSTAGEVDIVATEGATLVVVEVKTRTSHRFGTPAEAVTVAKMHRLRRLAGQFLSESTSRFDQVRIDVVAVLLPLDGRVFVKHLCGVS